VPLALAAIAAARLGRGFVAYVLVYGLNGVAYSLHLKNVPILDVVGGRTAHRLFTGASSNNPALVVGVPIVFFGIMHCKRRVMRGEVGEEPSAS